MKLIKRGEKVDKLWRGTCQNCGSIFEAFQGEVSSGRGIKYDEKRDDYVSYKDCPECGAGATYAVVFCQVK